MPSPLVEEVSRLVSEITGVQLGARQAAMVESRLARRMIQLGIQKPEDYLAHLKAHEDSEVVALVSLLTTHHTNFFREFSHFEYLLNQGLPNLIAARRKENKKVITVWSAACSRGQEVYSLSMFLSHHLKTLAPEMTFKIVGSDVDPESVAICRNGVYRWEEIKSIPAAYLDQHWIRGTGEISDFVKARETIKAPTEFLVANLLDFSKEMAGRTFDIIFCRNVFIYFTIDQIKDSTRNLLKHLHPDGLLFIGISESLNGTDLPVSYLAPSVYCHKTAAKAAPKTAVAASAAAASAAVGRATATAGVTASAGAPPSAPGTQLLTGPLKVLCVDDSPTILALLKKILSPEHGFEVVDTAPNGVEAANKIKQHKVDIMTLDIHMPVQTGVEYLERNMKPDHPPVVMITSVSREDAALGIRSLELGAMDYIEKPGLNDLSKRADEIRMKLRYAATFGREKGSQSGAVDLSRSFQRTAHIKTPEKKLRIVLGGLGDRYKLTKVLKSMSGSQPPTVVFVQGNDAFLEPLAKSLQGEIGSPVRVLTNPNDTLQPGSIYVADLAGTFNAFHATHAGRPTSIIVFGDVTSEGAWTLANWPSAEFLIEDIGAVAQEVEKKLVGQLRRLVPYTSFEYHSTDYLSRVEPK